jgi:hypothetical protein
MDYALLEIKTQVIKINYHVFLSLLRRSKNEGDNNLY